MLTIFSITFLPQIDYRNLIALFAVVDKRPDNAARVNVLPSAFSARSNCL